jgi:RNA polymerase sigma-70 factor (ECF subfamily)
MLAALTDTAPPAMGPRQAQQPARAEPPASTATLDFEAVYEQHFDFIWRSLRRLGVRDALIDDAAQDVFVVVHKRLSDFEGRSSLKTWLFGVALRVARNYRRTAQRRDADALPETVADTDSPGPHEATAQAEAVRTLHALLDTLADERRAVFVMMELEQMSAPEVADALGVNLNTVYSRLRKARNEFEAALTRHRARSCRP